MNIYNSMNVYQRKGHTVMYNVVHINVLPRIKEAILFEYGDNGILKSYEVPAPAINVKPNIQYKKPLANDYPDKIEYAVQFCNYLYEKYKDTPADTFLRDAFGFNDFALYDYHKIYGDDYAMKTNGQLMLEQAPIVGYCEHGPVVVAGDDDGILSYMSVNTNTWDTVCIGPIWKKCFVDYDISPGYMNKITFKDGTVWERQEKISSDDWFNKYILNK